jgi:hypothetical protein
MVSAWSIIRELQLYLSYLPKSSEKFIPSLIFPPTTQSRIAPLACDLVPWLVEVFVCWTTQNSTDQIENKSEFISSYRKTHESARKLRIFNRVRLSHNRCACDVKMWLERLLGYLSRCSFSCSSKGTLNPGYSSNTSIAGACKVQNILPHLPTTACFTLQSKRVELVRAHYNPNKYIWYKYKYRHIVSLP